LLTSGCSASNLIALAVARNAGAGFDVRGEGLAGAPRRLTVYCSEEAHSSLTKAVELLGMGTRSLRRVPTDDLLRIDLAALAEMVAADRAAGLRPVCVVGVAGTTNTGSIDDLPGLADYCEREGLWFHVDGAFGAWAAIAPASRHLVAGMERADSLAFDLHKWMNLTYPVGCVLVRDAEAQLRTFSLTPSYLAHGEGERGLTGVDVPWLSDFGFELSRGFHALKAWMALKEHGADKFRRIIQQNIDQARYLEGLVAAAPELEQALPAQLNIVCFRYVGSGAGGAAAGATGPDDAALDQLNKEIELELQERGIAVPSVSTIGGRTYLHVAVANHRSRREDFDLLVREVVRLGGELAGG
jgi:glutamate/tyrosine decarboxylase-like PLP-dependent enzyme